MKKIILAVALFIGSAAISNAQVKGNAIGVRAGSSLEISYQHALGTSNRLELDLGTSYFNSIYLAGAYQWVWDLSALAPGFNWYAGVGAELGLYDSSFSVGVLGDIGIEYNFSIPLQLAIDYRPTIYFTDFGRGFYGIAASIRYKF